MNLKEQDDILIKTFRGHYLENVHRGWALVVNEQGDILKNSAGAETASVFFRSLEKPFQAFPLLKLNFHLQHPSEALAIACASHSGSPEHLTWVRYLLNACGLDESFLQCGEEFPLDPDHSSLLKQAGASAARIYHNCSGKHAAMLYYCVHAGFSVENYLALTHPLQQEIAACLANWTGLPKQDIGTATDGCGAPVHFLPLSSIAKLYAGLAGNADFLPVLNSIKTHPYLISGSHRADYLIARIGEGSLIAKAGADGLMAVIHLPSRQALVVKMRDGLSSMRNHFTLKALETLGWIHPKVFSKDTILYNEFKQQTQAILLNANKQAVGEIVCETTFLH